MVASDFIAIDIGNKTIKLIQIQRQSETSARLLALGSINFPQNLNSAVPSSEEPEKLQLLASVIKSLVKSSGVKTNQVVAALPESIIFTKLLTLPILDPVKLEETIHWETKNYIPIPLEEAQMDWIEIGQKQTPEGRKVVDVMVIVAPRKIVESYLQLFEAAELELIALEVESIALSRSLGFNGGQNLGNTMLVDIGGSGSVISVIFNGRLLFSQSLSTGADDFTRAIATDFGLQPAQAEQYKFAYGMKVGQADGGKIYNSIKPISDVLVNEIRKILGFIGNRLSYGAPQQIILSGNGSLLPGLAEYLQASLNLKASLFNPFVNLKMGGDLKNIQNEINPIGFSVAVGLGLKNE